MSKVLLPFPSEFSFSIADASIDNVATCIDKILRALDLQWQFRPAVSAGVGLANENVWSRTARRQKRKVQTDVALKSGQNAMDEESEDDKEPVFGFKVQVRGSQNGGAGVLIRWLRGHESMLFESFCGMLRRQILEALPNKTSE